MKPKALTYELDTTGLSMNDVASINYTMFVSKTYDWWYEVLPGDTVVDIGASIGAFSAKALDAGAKRVYMIEPNKQLLKTAVKNVSDYIIDTEDRKVFAINAAIGKTDVDLSNIYKSSTLNDNQQEPPLMSLRQLLDTNGLTDIDFLKVSVGGAEFNILDADMLDFITENVRHIAVVVNLNAQYGSKEKFVKWRDTFLKPLMDSNKVNFQDYSYAEKLFEPNFNELVPGCFLVYITNW